MKREQLHEHKGVPTATTSTVWVRLTLISLKVPSVWSQAGTRWCRTLSKIFMNLGRLGKDNCSCSHRCKMLSPLPIYRDRRKQGPGALCLLKWNSI